MNKVLLLFLFFCFSSTCKADELQLYDAPANAQTAKDFEALSMAKKHLYIIQGRPHYLLFF